MSNKCLPYIPFYPNDWLSDTGLRLCSPAAQGLWINLICLMWKSERRGYLYHNGRPLTLPLTCALIGYQEINAKPLFDELETNKVFSREEDGTIYSRKIVRLLESRDKASENGKKGGNPVLKPLTPPLTPTLKPIEYSLEYSLDTKLVDEIYKLYPSKRPNGSHTAKRPNDKEKIAKHLKAGIDLKALVELYTRKTNPEWYQALKTFLNGLPDREELEKAVDFKDQSKPKPSTDPLDRLPKGY